MSVISPRCASLTAINSSPVFESYFATLPESCPVRTASARGAKSATVAFEPEMMISLRGVLVSAASRQLERTFEKVNVRRTGCAVCAIDREQPGR